MSFTKGEYKQRLKKVQSMMQDKGIELLISHDTNNMNYLTGYDAWSFYYAQCAIVHVNADEPLCFVRAQDSGGAYIKTYLKDENIIVYDENYIHTWPKHPYDYLVQIIKDRNWDKLQEGDLMFFGYYRDGRRRIDHVAIWIGDGNFIQASKNVKSYVFLIDFGRARLF